MTMAATMMSERRPLEKTLSGYDIMIGLEDERGQLAPVDIDEADDVISDVHATKGASMAEEKQVQAHYEQSQQQTASIARHVSINQQVLKARNSEHELQGLQELAMSRKQQFAALLQEHAQIVNSVHRLEGADTAITTGISGTTGVTGTTGASVATPDQHQGHGDKENH